MGNERYRVVHPDGDIKLVRGELPETGYDLGGYRVDFISHRQDEPTVYLGLHYGQQAIVKLVAVIVAGEKYPLTIAESAEIAERLRDLSAEDVESPATAVAVRFEQLVEETPGSSPEMSFLESENAALREALEVWLLDVGSENLPCA